MEQCQEVGYDAFHLVGDEHLVAIELYLITLKLDVRLDPREIKDTCEVERIVDVQVNPEQRFVLHGIKRAIELLVVLVLQRRWRLCPERLHVVDDVVFVGVLHLAVFPFLLLAEDNRYRQELTVLLQELFNLVLLKKLLAVVVDVENDVRTAVVARCILDGELRASVARPLHGLCTFLIAAGDDFHFLRHHEGRIESQTEMANDSVGVVLVFVKEIGYAREGYLVDILIDFLFRHADAPVADGQRAGLLVKFDLHA